MCGLIQWVPNKAIRTVLLMELIHSEFNLNHKMIIIFLAAEMETAESLWQLEQKAMWSLVMHIDFQFEGGQNEVLLTPGQHQVSNHFHFQGFMKTIFRKRKRTFVLHKTPVQFQFKWNPSIQS